MLKTAGELLLWFRSRNFLSRKKPPRQFNLMVSRSSSFFVVLPVSSADVPFAVAAIRGLASAGGKQITVLARHEHLSLLENTPGIKTEEYFPQEAGKTGLPKLALRNRLRQYSADAVLDLEREECNFSCSCAMAVTASLYCGFRKKLSDRFYEFQFDAGGQTPEESYKNFLNCLKMF